MNDVIFLVSLLFALIRVYIGIKPKLDMHSLSVEIFKDAAHLYVGGLFGASLAGQNGYYFANVVVLSIIEVMVAVGSRLIKK